MRSALLGLALTACSFSGPGAGGGGGDAAPDIDAGGDAAVDAMQLGPWGTPVRVTELEFGNNPAGDNYDDPSITESGVLYFAARGGVSSNSDIYRARRRANGTFMEPEVVVELTDTNVTESNLWVERDHSRIIFGRDQDLFESTRDPIDDLWAAPAPITELNTAGIEGLGQLTDGGLTLYFVSDRDNDPGVLDIFRATRSALDQPFDSVEKLPISSPDVSQLSVKLSDDGLTMYWSEKPAAAATSQFEIVFLERADTGVEFSGTPTPVDELNAINAIDSDFSPGPDHRSAFFSSDRANTAQGERIFFVER